MNTTFRFMMLGAALGLAAAAVNAQGYGGGGGGGGRRDVGPPPAGQPNPNTGGSRTSSGTGSTGADAGSTTDQTAPAGPAAGATAHVPGSMMVRSAVSCGRAGGGGPAGAPMKFERSAESKKLLRVLWDFPVTDAEAQTLAWRKALDTVAADDLRPLLIVRECQHCAGSDEEEIARRLGDERTSILTRWFHCVKLSGAVCDPSHQFNQLFPGARIPHIVVVDRKGEKPITFDGNQTQSELWKAMYAKLDEAYPGDARRAVAKLYKQLDDFDRLFAREADLERQLDLMLENRGSDSSSTRNLEKKLEQVRAEIEDARAEERRLADIGELRAAAAAAAATTDAGTR